MGAKWQQRPLALVLIAVVPAMMALVPGRLSASSHREAPAIAKDPAADISDFYVFKTPGKDSSVTFIMNVYPGMVPQAGPNWHQFADDAMYEILVDSDGDGQEDITYQFRFKTRDYKDQPGNILPFFPDIKFEGGQFTGGLSQSYTLTRVNGPRRKGIRSQIRKDVPVAPPRIGPYTTDGGAAAADNVVAMYTAYKTLAANAQVTERGYRMFAGPRNDSFFADLGGAFDRVALRIPGKSGTPKDSLAGLNVLSIVLEVPTTDLVDVNNNFFGAWATVSRAQGTVRRPGGKDNKDGGPLIQVSRLGNPLFNELFVRLRDKDRFNGAEPRDDNAGFAGFLLRPQLATVINLLYARGDGTPSASEIAIDPDLLKNRIADTNRVDLIKLYLDGLIVPNGASVNRHPKSKDNSGDMIRVNLGLPEKLQHWPFSGRRVEDDVVKGLLTFVAQCSVFPTITGDLTTNLVVPNGAENHPKNWQGSPDNGLDSIPCVLDDFVTEPSDKTQGSTSTNGLLPGEFPYIDAPHSSYGKAN